MTTDIGRVFVARTPEEPYMEISSGGDFINPLVAAFPLKDTQQSLIVKEKLYIVVLNRMLSQVALRVFGELEGANITVSWVDRDDHYGSYIEQEVNLEAQSSPQSVPFYVKYQIKDDMATLPLDQYRNKLQIRLIYL